MFNFNIFSKKKIDENLLHEQAFIDDDFDDNKDLSNNNAGLNSPVEKENFQTKDPRISISFKHFFNCLSVAFKDVFFELMLFFSMVKRLFFSGILNLVYYKAGVRSFFRFLKRLFYVLSGIALVYYCVIYFASFIYFCYYIVSRIIHVLFFRFLMLILKDDPWSLWTLDNFVIKYLYPFDFVESEFLLIPVNFSIFRKKYFSILALVDRIIDIILMLFDLSLWFYRFFRKIYFEISWFYFVKRFNFNRKYGKFKAVSSSIYWSFYKNKRKAGWYFLYYDIKKFYITIFFNCKQFFWYNLFRFQRFCAYFFYNLLKFSWMFCYLVAFFIINLLRYFILFLVLFLILFLFFVLIYKVYIFFFISPLA